LQEVDMAIQEHDTSGTVYEATTRAEVNYQLHFKALPAQAVLVTGRMWDAHGEEWDLAPRTLASAALPEVATLRSRDIAQQALADHRAGVDVA
jgi:hypothetical protein